MPDNQVKNWIKRNFEFKFGVQFLILSLAKEKIDFLQIKQIENQIAKV